MFRRACTDIPVAVTDAGGADPDQDFPFFRWGQLEGLDLERLSCSRDDGCLYFHLCLLPEDSWLVSDPRVDHRHADPLVKKDSARDHLPGRAFPASEIGFPAIAFVYAGLPDQQEEEDRAAAEQNQPPEVDKFLVLRSGHEVLRFNFGAFFIHGPGCG